MFLENGRGYPGRRIPLADHDDLPPSIRLQSAFLPEPLPAEVELRPSTWRDLADAQEWVGRLDTAMAGVPHRDGVARMFHRLEARYSAVLDGVITSTREVLAAELPGAATPDTDQRLVRYLRAGEHAAAAIRDGRGLDVALWGRLSAILTGVPVADRPPWREDLAWLGGPGPEDAYLVVAPPGADLRVATAQWCAWLDSQTELPVLAKVVLAQFQFELLSPFPGSGHLTRLFPAIALTHAGVLKHPVLAISAWLRRHQLQRRAVLWDVIGHGNIDRLMTFMATGIRETCADQIRLVTELAGIFTQTVARVPRRTAISRLAEALIDRPVISLSQIPGICRVSAGHATTVARRLHEAGLVEIVDPRTLEFQAEEIPYGKVIVAAEIARLFSVFQPPPPPDGGRGIFD